MNDAPALVILRLLSGTLRGGEFALGGGTTLLVAAPAAAFYRDGAQPDFPENALFIPADQGGGNFEVEVTQQPDQAVQVTLRDLAAGSSSPYVFNTVRRIGGLDIALRLPQDAWPDEVLDYAGDALASPQRQALPAPAVIPLRKPGRALRNALALLAALGVCILVAWRWQADAPRQAQAKEQIKEQIKAQAAQRLQMAQLSASLTGAVGQYRIVPGRDGLVYVFADDERDAGWARQAVARSALADKTRVLQQSELHARIVALLDGRQGPLAYHMLRLEDPARPALWLSRERAALDAAGRQALADSIAAALPYVDAARVEALADRDVLGSAEAGLDLLGVRHRKIRHAGGVTMAIHGALADGELQKLQTFIAAFYRQWGTDYIHFSVEMADDPRKGKSFEYGGKGYVKVAPSHWDFSV